MHICLEDGLDAQPPSCAVMSVSPNDGVEEGGDAEHSKIRPTAHMERIKIPFAVDETPTPSRYMDHTCEGLFEEVCVYLNPFDEQFRRASHARAHQHITLECTTPHIFEARHRCSNNNNRESSTVHQGSKHVSSRNSDGCSGNKTACSQQQTTSRGNECSSSGDEESLDTPRIVPPTPADSDHTISSTSRDEMHHHHLGPYGSHRDARNGLDCVECNATAKDRTVIEGGSQYRVSSSLAVPSKSLPFRSLSELSARMSGRDIEDISQDSDDAAGVADDVHIDVEDDDDDIMEYNVLNTSDNIHAAASSPVYTSSASGLRCLPPSYENAHYYQENMINPASMESVMTIGGADSNQAVHYENLTTATVAEGAGRGRLGRIKGADLSSSEFRYGSDARETKMGSPSLVIDPTSPSSCSTVCLDLSPSISITTSTMSAYHLPHDADHDISSVVTQTYSSPSSSCSTASSCCPRLGRRGSKGRLSINVTSAVEAGRNTTTVISTPTPVITAGPSLTQCLQDLSSAGDCALVAAASSSPAPSPPSPLITSAQPYSVSDVHHHHHHTGDVDLSSPAADNLKRNIPENNRSRKRKNNVFGHKKIFFRTDVAIDEKTDSVPAVCAEGVVASAVCAARVTAPSVGTGRVAAPSVGTETVVVPDVCAHRVPPAECADSVVAPVVCAGGVALPPATPTSVVTAPALPLASPSATVLQLFLRLPNGQAIPVEIPATPLVSPPSTPPEPPPSTSTQQRHQPSLAKMRLKAALQASVGARPTQWAPPSRAHTAHRIAAMTRGSGGATKQSCLGVATKPAGDNVTHSAARTGGLNNLHDESPVSINDNNISSNSNNSSNISNNSSNNNCSNSSGGNAANSQQRSRHLSKAESIEAHFLPSRGRKRSRGFVEEEGSEKRIKFLERNRAAAVRCREKKKEWVERLACKSSELASVNNRLQVEVSGLRTEVAHLKMLLLKHRTCPVTLAELQEGRSADPPLSEEIPSPISTPVDIQQPSPVSCVPADNSMRSLLPPDSTIYHTELTARSRSLSLPSLQHLRPPPSVTVSPARETNLENYQLLDSMNASSSAKTDFSVASNVARRSTIPAVVTGVAFINVPPPAVHHSPLKSVPASVSLNSSEAPPGDCQAFPPQQLQATANTPVSQYSTFVPALMSSHIVPGAIVTSSYQTSALLGNPVLLDNSPIHNNNNNNSPLHQHQQQYPVIAPAPPGLKSSTIAAISAAVAASSKEQFTLTSLASSLQLLQSSLTSSSRILSSKISTPSLATIIESVPKMSTVPVDVAPSQQHVLLATQPGSNNVALELPVPSHQYQHLAIPLSIASTDADVPSTAAIIEDIAEIEDNMKKRQRVDELHQQATAGVALDATDTAGHTTDAAGTATLITDDAGTATLTTDAAGTATLTTDAAGTTTFNTNATGTTGFTTDGAGLAIDSACTASFPCDAGSDYINNITGVQNTISVRQIIPSCRVTSAIGSVNLVPTIPSNLSHVVPGTQYLPTQNTPTLFVNSNIIHRVPCQSVYSSSVPDISLNNSYGVTSLTSVTSLNSTLPTTTALPYGSLLIAGTNVPNTHAASTISANLFLQSLAPIATINASVDAQISPNQLTNHVSHASPAPLLANTPSCPPDGARRSVELPHNNRDTRDECSNANEQVTAVACEANTHDR